MVKTSLARFLELESELKEGQAPALVSSLWERETVIISDTLPHTAENTGCVFEIQMSPKYSSLRVAEEKAYQYALPRSQDEREKPPRVEEKKKKTERTSSKGFGSRGLYTAQLLLTSVNLSLSAGRGWLWDTHVNSLIVL